MRIAVCDDMPIYLEQFTEYLEAWTRHRQMKLELHCFTTGEELLWDWELNGDYTAVFLDIELDGMNGLETARRLREVCPLVSIVFISQYECYCKELFTVYPCRFLEKPVAAEKVFAVMDRIVEENRFHDEAFMFRHNRRTVNVALRRVLYFTSEKRLIRIVMEQSREYVFYERLNVLEKKLACYQQCFLRIHQSFLVNGRCIEQYHPSFVRMENGDRLPISKEYQGKVYRHHRERLRGFSEG